MSVALAARQEADHSLLGYQFQVLNLQPDQLIAAESSPKSPSNTSALSRMARKAYAWSARSLGRQRGLVQPPDYLGQLGQLQRRGLLFDSGV
ncbi:hypothetical protein XP2010_17015 [Xanthomonas perforans]|nr:hypothetical protein XP2010_17015 [Xanthomonas perforans]